MKKASALAWWIFSLCIFIIFCIVDLTSYARADDSPSITNLSIEKNAKYLLVSCTVKNGFTSDIINALKSGIVVKFNYDLELTIPGFIKDQSILSKTINKTIMLDTIKNEYRITLTQENTRIITTTDINDANDIIFNINQYPLAPITILEKNKTYKVRIKLSTDKIITDLPLNTILNTFSTFGYKTKWYETNFQY